MNSFNRAFQELIGHEGGYVNHPNDPGGETKYGITKRTYPMEDIRNLTLERAKEIYKRDFWDPLHGDELPWLVAFNLFDAAVNHGRGTAIRLMQRASEVADDGIIGPITMGAWAGADPDRLTARFLGERLQFFTKLSTWRTFGKGWSRRVAGNLLAIPLSPDDD